jgi:hypothetical protein
MHPCTAEEWYFASPSYATGTAAAKGPGSVNSGAKVVRPLLPSQSGPQPTSARSQASRLARHSGFQISPEECLAGGRDQVDMETGGAEAGLEGLGYTRTHWDLRGRGGHLARLRAGRWRALCQLQRPGRGHGPIFVAAWDVPRHAPFDEQCVGRGDGLVHRRQRCIPRLRLAAMMPFLKSSAHHRVGAVIDNDPHHRRQPRARV